MVESSDCMGLVDPAEETVPFALRKWAERFDVISFDIFDTALYRKGVFRPVDMFYRIGFQAKPLTGLDPASFAEVRINAEREARSRLVQRNGHEVHLDEIYTAFNDLLPTRGRLRLRPAVLTELTQIEIAIELASLRPMPSVKAFYNWAIGAGKRIFFVSDFYMPKSVLASVLEREGYGQYEALFVSIDEDCTKHHGDLYDLVCMRMGLERSSILHVGDNTWADGSRALQARIIHLPVNNPAQRLVERQALDWRKPIPPLTSSMLAFEKTYLFNYGLRFEDPGDRSLPERVGYEALGPLLLGLASWLYEESAREGFSCYHFCSRDGLVMKSAFDLYQAHFGERIRTDYLEVSRQVIYRARAAFDPDCAEELFLQNWLILSPAEVLRRWRLDPADLSKEILASGFFGPDDVVRIGDKDGASRLRKLFHACRDRLDAANCEHGKLFASYLEQDGLNEEASPCIVDIGWHGSLQKGIQAILPRGSMPIFGRYTGLFLQADQQRDFRGSGYLFSLDGTPRAIALRASPCLVELLHTASHGSVVGYRREGERIRALYEDLPDEVEQYNHTIGPIQIAALKFIEMVLAETRATHEPIAADYGFAGLCRLLNRPTRDEAAVLGRLRIAPNYGCGATSTALTDVSSNGYSLWDNGLRCSGLVGHQGR